MCLDNGAGQGQAQSEAFALRRRKGRDGLANKIRVQTRAVIAHTYDNLIGRRSLRLDNDPAVMAPRVSERFQRIAQKIQKHLLYLQHIGHYRRKVTCDSRVAFDIVPFEFGAAD